MLSGLYKYGNLAYIGGGFGSGIHNILEAVTFGLPVVFGPNYHKFNEAIDLINHNAAISISNYEELKAAIEISTNFDKSISLNYIKKLLLKTNLRQPQRVCQLEVFLAQLSKKLTKLFN